jgi:nucleotide-binding universal stress UspA family protein
MKRMRGILHATDFSRASSRAFASALDLARRQRAQLLLLHVMAPPSPFRASEPPTDYLALLAETRRDAQRRLGALLARARKRGVRARSKLTEGAPAQEIARVARRQRADIIVIGTHGRTGLARLLLGSVAARVLQLAACPVLTVRGR